MSVRADAAATTRAAVLSLEEEAIANSFYILTTQHLGNVIFACVALTCETRFMCVARCPVVVCFAVKS